MSVSRFCSLHACKVYVIFKLFFSILQRRLLIEITNYSKKKEFKMSWLSCSKRRLLNDLVKCHIVNCFSGFNTQYSDIFC